MSQNTAEIQKMILFQFLCIVQATIYSMAYPRQYPGNYWNTYSSLTGLRNVFTKKGFTIVNGLDGANRFQFENPPKRHNTQISAHREDTHLGAENTRPALEALQDLFSIASKSRKVKAHLCNPNAPIPC